MDLAEKFWRDWRKADLLKREKMLAPIVKNVVRAATIKEKKTRDFFVTALLQGYFEDLEMAMYVPTKSVVRKKSQLATRQKSTSRTKKTTTQKKIVKSKTKKKKI